MTVQLTPIGFMESIFKYKNGTPRQSQLCKDARGVLTIEKSIFNNPEHSLEDLESFTHVWILFLFHRNSGCASKAKVRPPRLGGRRVGVFSTRSPHRPNPIGLTLAKLDAIRGDKMYISGIDIIDGTPVLDVKPYIQEYDTPHWNHALNPDTMSLTACDATNDTADTKLDTEVSGIKNRESLQDCPVGCDESFKVVFNDSIKLAPKTEIRDSEDKDLACGDKQYPLGCDRFTACETVKYGSTSLRVTDVHTSSDLNYTETTDACQGRYTCGSKGRSSAPDAIDGVVSPGDQQSCVDVSSSWIPSVDKRLQVHFTERALQQLCAFSKYAENAYHRLGLLDNADEAKRAIISMLTEDPRSVYRRKKCADSLYFFTVDRLHVTCWFDLTAAEVVRIQSIDCALGLLPNY